MESLVKEFLAQKNFAVVGSFRSETKYAYKIVKALKESGYIVYPVNPGMKEVQGLPCYAGVHDILSDCDVVNIVTPPQVSEKIVRDCKKRGIFRVWLQPGAESDAVIEYCRENGIKVVYGLCLMLEKL